jgi:hypothetical protein
MKRKPAACASVTVRQNAAAEEFDRVHEHGSLGIRLGKVRSSEILSRKRDSPCPRRGRIYHMRKNVVVDEAEVPIGKIGHVILDDYDSNKHPKDQAWLGRHPRFVFYYTPTSCSWLNAVEGFFAKLTRCRLKRGFLRETNDNPKPFTWTADPDKIIAAVRRGHHVLDSNH